MSIYFFLYLVAIFGMIYLSLTSYIKSKKNCSNLFLSLSIASWTIWLIFYFLSFTTTYDQNVLLILSRIIYVFGLLGCYSMIFYMLFLKVTKTDFHKWMIVFFIVFFGGLALLTFFTDFVIQEMVYDPNLKINYEVFGPGFLLYKWGYLIYPFIYAVLGYITLKRLNKINKVRFKFLFLGYGVFVYGLLFFLAFLPLLNIWIFQKEQVIFFLPFLLSVFYVSYRYNFIDINLFFSKIFNFFVSIFISLGSIYILQAYLESKLDKRLVDFWGIIGKNQYIDILLGIILFLGAYVLLQKIFPGNQKYITLSKKLGKIRKKLSYLYNIGEVNRFLEKEMKGLFQINHTQIHLDKPESSLENMKKYFQKNTTHDLFINDIVFIEENKNKFDYEKIADEIDSRTYLVFPLFTLAGRFLGVLELGSKNFRDAYTSEEIELLQDFTQYLVSHIKYTEIYKEIQDVNVNLDKKVDEKTMMYNNLLNKQTDFISMASHEIKNPLGSAIFQLDCLIDDIKEKAISQEKMMEELEVLNTQIVRVGTLTKNIFSSQKYDLEKIELYKQNICIDDFLANKIELNQKWFPEVEFVFFAQQEVIYNAIDKIQFEQVIDNLVNNAIKFIPKDGGKIQISLNVKEEKMYVNIEDNGPGFSADEAAGLFDKYSSGDIKNTGLGLGLYLCKKIIEFHLGSITAGKSELLGGAKFEIELPIIKTVDSNHNI